MVVSAEEHRPAAQPQVGSWLKSASEVAASALPPSTDPTMLVDPVERIPLPCFLADSLAATHLLLATAETSNLPIPAASLAFCD